VNDQEFRKKLKELKLSITKFSKICGVGYSTAKDWKITPKWVPFVLNYIQITQNMNIDYKDGEKLTINLKALKDIKKDMAEI
jgi:predicted transcriptional regulator